MEITIKSIQFRKADRHAGSFRKTRIFIHPTGESVMEHLCNRTGRPHQEFRKQVLPELFRRFDLPEDTKVQWSQHAGCSMCPCSPGFIVKGDNLMGPNGQPADIFVDVEGAESEARDIAVAV